MSDHCGDCGKGPITTKMTEDKLKYATGVDQVELTCTLPLRHCEACGFDFLDHESEKIRFDTVNSYLLSVGQKPYCEKCQLIECICAEKKAVLLDMAATFLSKGIELNKEIHGMLATHTPPAWRDKMVLAKAYHEAAMLLEEAAGK